MPGAAPARALRCPAVLSVAPPALLLLVRLVGTDLGLRGRRLLLLAVGVRDARALLLALGEGTAERRHEVLVAHRGRRGRRVGGAEGTDVEVRHPLVPLRASPLD